MCVGGEKKKNKERVREICQCEKKENEFVGKSGKRSLKEYIVICISICIS